MSQLPDGIDLPRHRDFEGRETGQWIRRGFLVLLVAFVVAALLDAFGQGTVTDEASGAGATLSLSAPTDVRGGLMYQARIHVRAEEALRAPTLRFDRGWFEQTTVNTIEPEAESTTSDEKYVRMRYPPLAAGETLVVYLDLQANPTNVGSHDADVALYEGSRQIATIDRSQMDWP